MIQQCVSNKIAGGQFHNIMHACIIDMLHDSYISLITHHASIISISIITLIMIITCNYHDKKKKVKNEILARLIKAARFS